MKKVFKEYHQFTDEEFKKIWKNGLFIFDTNTLLNMYRYSRKTVDIYFEVLKKLKNQKQIWIPYQVGYEFYENRINIISENEKSYDKILEVLNNAKVSIEKDYKDHPFLDIKEINNKINKGLLDVEKEIKKAKEKHPKWLEKDDVLASINNIFLSNVGENYDEKRLEEIKKEGIIRFEKMIPPGFKDKKKEESKKYGDLILWFQIIDKAKELKKPIIFISGDVKEDWWLEKDGKRIMPLPQLKKEIYDKAGVDFHIYTPERFLELSDDKIERKTIDEIRKISELEEKKMMIQRRFLIENDKERDLSILYKKYYYEYIELFEKIELFFREIEHRDIEIEHKAQLEYFHMKFKKIRNEIAHGKISPEVINDFYPYFKEFKYIFDRILLSESLPNDFSIYIKNIIEKLDYLNHKIRRFL